LCFLGLSLVAARSIFLEMRSNAGTDLYQSNSLLLFFVFFPISFFPPTADGGGHERWDRFPMTS